MSCIQYKDYTQQFKFISKIGNGNCASVVKIQDIKNKKLYALKYAKFDTVSKLVVALQEIQVVRAINHPAAIQIYFYFVKNDLCNKFIAKQIELGIIMELGDRSLQQDMLIRNKKQQYYTLDQIEEIVKILVDFFAFCQEKGYMHRDIKPANILIMPNIQQNRTGGNQKTTKYSKYKVCDFGFAIKNHELSDKNIAGTASYASPKIQNKFKNVQLFIKGNNFKDDVYSLGITILELCILHPIEQVSPHRFISKISNRYGLKMASFIQLMTEIYEQKRPDFIDLQNLLPKHLNRKSNSIQNKFIQSFQIHQDYIIENLNNPTIKYLQKIHKKSISQQRTRISQSVSCEQLSRLYKQQQSSIKEVRQLDFINKQYTSLDIDIAQNKNRQTNLCVYINSTPKINKGIEKYNKKTQQKIQKKSTFEQQFLRISTEKDKIRTKRRSKMINNIFNNQFKADKINARNINNQSAVLIQNKSITKQKYANSIKQKQIPKQKNQHKKTNNLVQDGHILFKFENIQIQSLQVIELALQKPKLKNISMICMVVSGKVYIVHQLFKKTEIVEIKLDTKQQIFSLDYFSKTQKFAIIFKTDNLLLIKMPILLNQLTKNQSSITIEILAPISHQMNTKNMVAYQISKKSDDIIKAFRNGDVFENNRLLLKSTSSQQIQFVRKTDQNLYLAMLNGCICKFLISDNQVSDSSKMIGYYDCKSTLLGFQIMKDQYNKESIIVAVTVSGFLLKLNLRLQLLTIKKISTNCLRACTINGNLQKGKKILVIQTNGNIINQNGDNIYATGIIKSTKIKTINEGKNVIISNQAGTVFQIQINSNPRYPYNQDFN